MICDTRMLKIAYYRLLLNFQQYRSPSARDPLLFREEDSLTGKKRQRGERKKEKINLISYNGFRTDER